MFPFLLRNVFVCLLALAVPCTAQISSYDGPVFDSDQGGETVVDLNEPWIIVDEQDPRELEDVVEGEIPWINKESADGNTFRIRIRGTRFDDEIKVDQSGDKVHASVYDPIARKMLVERTFRISVDNISQARIDAKEGNDVVQSNFELFLETYGGKGDDKIVTRDGNVRTFGQAGCDFVDHMGGHTSELHGGDDMDLILCGPGDREFGGNVTPINTATGGEGNDLILSMGNGNHVSGNSGNDIIENYSGFGFDLVFDGGAGDDHLIGGNGDDLIRGGGDNDVIFGLDGHDTIDGGGGHDRIVGGIGNDTISGGGGDDDIFGDAGADTLDGNTDSDYIHGGSGMDTIDAGDGLDQVDSRDGEVDTVELGPGVDLFRIDQGDRVTILWFQEDWPSNLNPPARPRLSPDYGPFITKFGHMMRK